MTLGKPKSNGGPASPADDSKPDLKWVVEWLVGREGQRRTAALLGVNRKTVALALRRERLTGRMTLPCSDSWPTWTTPDGRERRHWTGWRRG